MEMRLSLNRDASAMETLEHQGLTRRSRDYAVIFVDFHRPIEQVRCQEMDMPNNFFSREAEAMLCSRYKCALRCEGRES
jgi:hypothetical protein